MQSRLLRPTQVFIIVSLVTIICLSTFILACNDQESPDEIRRRTAQATETMRRDTKAMVEGVKEGMGHNGAVNINKASREELLTLPDLTDREADSHHRRAAFQQCRRSRETPHHHAIGIRQNSRPSNRRALNRSR